MAKVIIDPDQRHILRHIQPRIIQVQNLLIGNKCLHHIFCPFLPQYLLQYLPLVPEYLLHKFYLLPTDPLFIQFLIFMDLTGDKARVVNPSHTDGICVFVIPVLLQSFPPVFPDPFPVLPLYGIIIVQIGIALPLPPWLPFIPVAPQEHVAVGGSHDDPHLIRQLPVAGIFIKIIDMHRRPYVICLQTEQQLKYLFIQLRSYRPIRCMLLRPCLQLLLVIDKDAPVLYRWIVCQIESRGNFKGPFPDRNIPEIVPGRDTHPPGQFIYSVHGSSPVHPGNI